MPLDNQTRPTGEQLRFRSATTGDWLLDAYLEACELGGRTLPDLLADIFTDSGNIDPANFGFRVNSTTRSLQFRVGQYIDPTAGWVDVPSAYIYRQRGTHATATAYEQLDVVTLSNSSYVCTVAHTSTTSTPDLTKFAIILDGAALNTATTAAQTSATAAASSATAAATSATSSASSATASQTSATNSANSATSSQTSATNSANSATSAAGSATTATTQATTATTKASEAATSATNAASSASTASTQATNAASSASSASTSAATATTQASSATTSATNAAASASTATTKASEASTSATSAAGSATTATTQATNAASSATTASSANTSALAAQVAAESARDATLAAYDSFDDRYLGTKTSDPTVDNDGNALVAGSLYFNSTLGSMKIYTGSAWVSAYVSGTGFVSKTGDTMTGALVLSGDATANLNPVSKQQFDTGLALKSPLASPTFTGTPAAPTAAVDTSTTQLATTAFVINQGYLKLTGGNVTGAVNLATTSGNVGIGTASPSTKLNVYTGSATNTLIRPQNTLGYADFGVLADGSIYGGYSAPATGTGVTVGTSNSTYWRVLTNATEALRIDSTGNVGIGTSSPGKKLDVFNSGTTTTDLVVRNGTVSLLSFVDSGAGYFGTSTNHPLLITTNNTERMRIDSSGNVGIGTASPASKLDINGNLKLNGFSIYGGSTTSSTALYAGTAFNTGGASIAIRGTAAGFNNGGIEFYTGSGATGTQNMTIDATGNVSIPISLTTPTVIATSGNSLNVRSASGQTSAAVKLQKYDGTTLGYLYNDGTSMFFLNGSGTGIFTVGNANGNVTASGTITGVGTYSSTGSNAAYQFADRLTTTNSWTLYSYSNTVKLFKNIAGVTGDMFTLDASGNLVASGNVTAYSDERFKTNWRDIPSDTIAQLSQVKSGIFDRTDQDSTQVGVSAQSLRKVLPNAIHETEDGTLTVAYGNAAMVAVIELCKEVMALRAEIEALKGKDFCKCNA
ncbi:Intramolecular chaperone auto-processing domain containing protein [uncultured Caudovirales phage]|uniref:Intramolecular chaperone auto-processing domain containing protein n=1 Tax=uncultured Caudovirales phage TaxID=2100421 RepID=A0A6J7WQD3_9CAUD|nr:Intramolecular chaperone auto-processing domain containing protein [uncultured Caudovirales phage]